jgi:hypothetical protein
MDPQQARVKVQAHLSPWKSHRPGCRTSLETAGHLEAGEDEGTGEHREGEEEQVRVHERIS